MTKLHNLPCNFFSASKPNRHTGAEKSKPKEESETEDSSSDSSSSSSSSDESSESEDEKPISKKVGAKNSKKKTPPSKTSTPKTNLDLLLSLDEDIPALESPSNSSIGMLTPSVGGSLLQASSPDKTE